MEAKLTLEQKNLIFKDLCARLPYGVRVKSSRRKKPVTLSLDIITDFHLGCTVKPYLRPMSSMTEKEMKEYLKYAHYGNTLGDWTKSIDFLNAHHFDYLGLIEKGLALEAPVDMYNLK